MISPEVLRRFPYFSGISEYSLKQIAMISEEKEVAAGNEVFIDGDTLHHLYVITRGELDVLCVFESGERKVVDTLVPGELAAWSAVVEPYKATATGMATKALSLIAIDAASLRGLMDKDHTLGYRLMSEVAKAVSHRLAGSRIQLAALS
jgi:toluene monooxygenase system ferredoxin subunit